jgi:hypothetical protein
VSQDALLEKIRGFFMRLTNQWIGCSWTSAGQINKRQTPRKSLKEGFEDSRSYWTVRTSIIGACGHQWDGTVEQENPPAEISDSHLPELGNRCTVSLSSVEGIDEKWISERKYLDMSDDWRWRKTKE